MLPTHHDILQAHGHCGAPCQRSASDRAETPNLLLFGREKKKKRCVIDKLHDYVTYKIVQSSALKELVSVRLSTMTRNIRQTCDRGTLVSRAGGELQGLREGEPRSLISCGSLSSPPFASTPPSFTLGNTLSKVPPQPPSTTLPPRRFLFLERTSPAWQDCIHFLFILLLSVPHREGELLTVMTLTVLPTGVSLPRPIRPRPGDTCRMIGSRLRTTISRCSVRLDILVTVIVTKIQ